MREAQAARASRRRLGDANLARTWRANPICRRQAARASPPLPAAPNQARAARPLDPRQIINSILCRLRVECSWLAWPAAAGVARRAADDKQAPLQLAAIARAEAEIKLPRRFVCRIAAAPCLLAVVAWEAQLAGICTPRTSTSRALLPAAGWQARQACKAREIERSNRRGRFRLAEADKCVRADRR